MNLNRRTALAAAIAAVSLAGASAPAQARPGAADLTSSGRQSLDMLYATEPKARFYARHALAVLVFPSIYKGGLMVGAQTGDGVLFMGGRPSGFFNASAVSFGLQAGGQKYSAAMFFMNRRALGYLHRSGGWAIGSTPNVVIVNTGAALEANTTNLTQDVYIVPFGQKGLMAGIDIHASKITEIHPN
ncbi:MAG TPA: lipid-binding SYLF domain-containing protein [Caulobacteraceae bacterium]|jgi:lipid-binding SYLF domain-containing protein